MKKYWLGVMGALILVATAAYLYARREQVVNRDVVTIQQPPAAAPAKNLPNMGHPFKDTSMLKPPAGAKVAVIVFEDLECPACARAHPIVVAAVDRSHIALVRHDFPLTEIHVWSFDAAVTARYIEDNLSAKLADTFRSDVFAGQSLINSKDDLDHFTANWFQAHGQKLPFVMDPNGSCRQEVQADRALGDRLGIRSTPCIFVVTQSKWTPVTDVSQISSMIDAALSETAASAVPSPRKIDSQAAA